MSAANRGPRSRAVKIPENDPTLRRRLAPYPVTPKADANGAGAAAPGKPAVWLAGTGKQRSAHRNSARHPLGSFAKELDTPLEHNRAPTPRLPEFTNDLPILALHETITPFWNCIKQSGSLRGILFYQIAVNQIFHNIFGDRRDGLGHVTVLAQTL